MDVKRRNILLELFFAFFKIGLFTIGGGYAMLPMLQKEVVEKYKWTTEDEIMNYYAIGQSTPGIIAINTATFIGFKKRGVIGAIVATLGMVTPSLIIIMSIARFFLMFSSNILVQKAFMGIRVVVIVLILNAVFKMAKKSIVNWILAIIAMLAFLSIVMFSVSPIYVIIISAIIGNILQGIKKDQ